jgi:hypothetical protein
MLTPNQPEHEGQEVHESDSTGGRDSESHDGRRLKAGLKSGNIDEVTQVLF